MHHRAASFVLLVSLACGVPVAVASQLQQKQADARRDHDALRERIAKLEKQIAGSESSRRDVTVELKKSETAISELDRKLASLERDTEQAGKDLKDVQRRITEQTAELGKRQEHLAEQLRAQYAGGLSPWATLLSGEDPQDIARELGYLEYVAQAQTKALLAVRSTLDELTQLQAQAEAHEQTLQKLAHETTRRRGELDTQRAERLAVLERIDGELKQQRGEARNLARNEAQLGQLVDELGRAIEEEAAAARRRAEEARRLAEERKRAEALRLAEERRLAEQQRQADARRVAEAQREAEAARRQAAAQADEQSRSEASRKIAEARRAADAIRAQQAAASGASAPAVDPVPAVEPVTVPRRVEPVSETPPPSVATLSPPAALNGLRKGLSYPVRGEVQGRFGMERPEGGIWRGIVLRASEGTRVAAVAPGRVVYAGWLGGFGNLIIIDHGEKYLSVYAYNQGLLKQVGDSIRAGEAIATVGATGGQVEPGLYFEIRHEGKPVNPLLWLKG